MGKAAPDRPVWPCDVPRYSELTPESESNRLILDMKVLVELGSCIRYYSYRYYIVRVLYFISNDPVYEYRTAVLLSFPSKAHIP